METQHHSKPQRSETSFENKPFTSGNITSQKSLAHKEIHFTICLSYSETDLHRTPFTFNMKLCFRIWKAWYEAMFPNVNGLSLSNVSEWEWLITKLCFWRWNAYHGAMLQNLKKLFWNWISEQLWSLVSGYEKLTHILASLSLVTTVDFLRQRQDERLIVKLCFWMWKAVHYEVMFRISKCLLWYIFLNL